MVAVNLEDVGWLLAQGWELCPDPLNEDGNWLMERSSLGDLSIPAELVEGGNSTLVQEQMIEQQFAKKIRR